MTTVMSSDSKETFAIFFMDSGYLIHRNEIIRDRFDVQISIEFMASTYQSSTMTFVIFMNNVIDGQCNAVRYLTRPDHGTAQ